MGAMDDLSKEMEQLRNDLMIEIEIADQHKQRLQNELEGITEQRKRFKSLLQRHDLMERRYNDKILALETDLRLEREAREQERVTMQAKNEELQRLVDDLQAQLNRH